MPALLLLLAALTGAAGTLHAQSGGSLAAVDRFLRAELRRQRLPGFSVAIVRDGRLAFARGYGYANLEHRVAATDSTVYQSGSVGKQFTAALVLQLADSGLLALDDPIRRWLPEGPPRWDSVTVRHLLTHTSGIPDYTDSVVDLRRDYSEPDLVRLAAALPTDFAPGARWQYSNTGYVLLGAIVRRATGRYYGDLLQERVFAPLGMRTARIISESALVPNRSDGYRRVGGALQHQEWVSPSLNTTADGSLYLTVRDLARWAAALDRGRGMSAGDRARAWTPVRLAGGGSYPYGFGWMLDPLRGRPAVFHTGSWQGFRAVIARFPASRLTVVVLANLAEAEPRAIAYGVAGLLEASLVPPHRLTAPLPGPRPPLGADAVLGLLARDSTSERLTPGLRRQLSPGDRHEWAELGSSAGDWSELGCDGAPAAAEVLGATVAHWCYARGRRPDGGVALTVTYTEDWRVAEADWYAF